MDLEKYQVPFIWNADRLKDIYFKRQVRRFRCEKLAHFAFSLDHNRFDFSAEEVAQAYKSRWQIELFSKHIKQNMTIRSNDYFSIWFDSLLKNGFYA